MIIPPIQNYKFSSEVKKTPSKKAKTEFAALIEDAMPEIEADTSVHGTQNVSNLGLIMLQAEATDDELKRQNHAKATQMLKYLDKMQQGVLSGQKVDLQDFGSRSKSSDLALESIVDEIELRASVENAKKLRDQI